MIVDTGKSFSEALILASTKPQYDIRLFIELVIAETSRNIVFLRKIYNYYIELVITMKTTNAEHGQNVNM